jgi:hypothetical protein
MHRKSDIKKALVEIISKLLVVFRMILRLQNITPSVFKEEMVDQFNKVIRIDTALFKNLVRQKEGKYDIPNYAVDDYSYLVLNEVNKILLQISEM